MIPKIVNSGSFNMDGPCVELLNTFSKGLAPSSLEKTAAVFDDRIKNIKPDPDKAYVHVISTGAQEYYGPNNNADGFNEGPRKHVFPDPAPGVAKVAMLRGGLTEYHDKCFLKNGAVYKNHVNSRKGGKPSGVIKFAAVNTDMHRGELLLELDSGKWSKEIEKLASGEPIFFSMGCSCPSDRCSICGHEAFTRDQYCEHLRDNPLGLDKEGNQVYAISDVPLFHDISGVFRPADKIAFGLRKVASGVITGADLAVMAGLTTPLDARKGGLAKQAAARLDILNKLAAIEKRILMKADAPECHLADKLKGLDADDEDLPEGVIDRLGSRDFGQVAEAMGRRMIMMPMGMFFKLVMGPDFRNIEGLLPLAKHKMKGVFGRMMEDSGELSRCLEDGSYEPSGVVDRSLAEDVERLVSKLSLDDGALTIRIMRTAAGPETGDGGSGGLIIKSAAEERSADFLAREYARYQLSYLTGRPENDLRLTAALNEAIV